MLGERWWKPPRWPVIAAYVLGEVCGLEAATMALLVEEGVRAGVLVSDTQGTRTRMAHDLFRETIG